MLQECHQLVSGSGFPNQKIPISNNFRGVRQTTWLLQYCPTLQNTQSCSGELLSKPLISVSSVVLRGLVWLSLPSTTHSLVMRLQSRWQLISASQHRLDKIQVEAASSKWVVTDSSGKEKLEGALSPTCNPAFVSSDGEARYSNSSL